MIRINFFLLSSLLFSTAYSQVLTPEVTVEERTNTQVTGDLKVTGNLHVEGVVTGDVTTFTKNLQITTARTSTGISFSDLETGTYIIQVYVYNQHVAGGHFHEYYSGVMSWFSTETNSPYADEITLHRAGHAPNSDIIQLCTKRNFHVNGGQLVLERYSNVHTYTTTDYVFKFKKMI